MTQLADAVRRSPDLDDFERLGRDRLPGLLGFQITSVERASVDSRLEVTGATSPPTATSMPPRW